MKPYYEEPENGITIYHADCRDVLPTFGDDTADLVFADPPYGVGKADWDNEFDLDWMKEAARVAPVVAVTPGVWNLTRMPETVGAADYRWTLAAHLRNGRGRGALGRGNWIPCVVYSRDESVKWTRRFRQWCTHNSITADDLSDATETSDMAGWWLSDLPHRAQIPTAENWQKIRARFDPPTGLDEFVDAADPMVPGVDSASFVVATEPMPEHPSPKPLNVMRWMLERIPGYRLSSRGILDPFMGSGTTLRAAKDHGRRSIGIEIEERYCEVAVQRLRQEAFDFGSVA